MEEKIQFLKVLVSAFLGSIVTACGGMDSFFKLLLILQCADVILGALNGIKKKKFATALLFWGIVNKGVMLAIVSIMYNADLATGFNVLRTTFIAWFSICEFGSLVENSASLGAPWPDGVKNILIQVRKGFSVNICKIVKQIIENYDVKLDDKNNKDKGKDDTDGNE